MAKYPALPLFTDAYLADTRHLTTLQHGAYLLLLMTAWRSPDCALPNDERLLSRFAGLDLRAWRNNTTTIMAFWQLGDDHKWRQRRLVDERMHADDVRSKNSANGKASALKRNNRHSTTVQPKSNAKATNPNPTQIDSDTKVSSSIPIAFPDWLPVDLFRAFKEMRKGIKSPMTPKAEELVIKQLDKLRQQSHDPTKVLEQSIRNNWKDVYALKGEQNENTSRNTGNGTGNQQGKPIGKSQWELAAEQIIAEDRATGRWKDRI